GVVVTPLRTRRVLIGRYELLAQEQCVGGAVRDSGYGDVADLDPGGRGVARRGVHVGRHDGAVPGVRLVGGAPGDPGVARVVRQDDGPDDGRGPAGGAVVQRNWRFLDDLIAHRTRAARDLEEVILFDERQELIHPPPRLRRPLGRRLALA